MTLWMEVTTDDLELPLVVAGSVTELARKIGKTNNTISSSVSKAKTRGYRSRYVKVEIDEEENDG